MDDFSKYLNEQLKDKEFKKEWDKLELRYRVIEEIISMRKAEKLSQSELAKKLGTTQSVISRIENGNINVGIDMLQRIAGVFGKKAMFAFV